MYMYRSAWGTTKQAHDILMRFFDILCYIPETGKRDDSFIKSPRGNKVFPDWIGGIISPGRLEINSDRNVTVKMGTLILTVGFS